MGPGPLGRRRGQGGKDPLDASSPRLTPQEHESRGESGTRASGCQDPPQDGSKVSGGGLPVVFNVWVTKNFLIVNLFNVNI